MPNPTVATSVTWRGDLRFTAETARSAITLDGDSVAGPSPVEALAFSLAGCMATDVVDILRKGRHALRAFDVRLVAERVAEHPRRFRRVTLQFSVHGTVSKAAVDRAIALSRDKYCSVFHSLRTDIQLLTSFEVSP